MKKVTAFVGSPRRKHTHDTVQQFLGNLQSLGGVECEVVHLGDHRVEQCRGCCVCFNRGEEFCPSGGDDRDLLIEKMMTSDGVVLASPTQAATHVARGTTSAKMRAARANPSHLRIKSPMRYRGENKW